MHDKELTYSFICPFSFLKNGENVGGSYKEISQILIDKLKEIEIDVDFGTSAEVNTKFDYCMLLSTGADLCYKGRKLIGSAQCRKNGYILQHGSILMDYDKSLLARIFNEPADISKIISIKEIDPSLTLERLVSVFSSL